MSRRAQCEASGATAICVGKDTIVRVYMFFRRYPHEMCGANTVVHVGTSVFWPYKKSPYSISTLDKTDGTSDKFILVYTGPGRAVVVEASSVHVPVENEKEKMCLTFLS